MTAIPPPGDMSTPLSYSPSNTFMPAIPPFIEPSLQNYIPPISSQRSLIASNLNASLMFMFCAGSYAGLFVLTLRIYIPPVIQSKHRIVLGVLIALFMTMVGQVILDWHSVYICFVTTSKSRLDMFYQSLGVNSTPAETMINIVMQGIGQILTDGLLMWRCWHILAQRRYARFALCCLYVTEVGLIILVNVISGLHLFSPRHQTGQSSWKDNLLQGGGFLLSATTSIIATFVIALHIHSSTSPNGRTRKRYIHIIDIITQSCILDTLAMLGSAYTSFIDNGTYGYSTIIDPIVNSEAYGNAGAVIMSAFAPTLMVARLASRTDTTRENTVSTNLTSLARDIESDNVLAHPEGYVPIADNQFDSCEGMVETRRD